MKHKKPMESYQSCLAESAMGWVRMGGSLGAGATAVSDGSGPSAVGCGVSSDEWASRWDTRPSLSMRERTSC